MLADSHSDVALILTVVLFVSIHGFLLTYSYTFQPCIGSGLVLNNIRVLAFSSSTYVGLATLIVLLFNWTSETALILLIPLPILWISVWVFNTKRARKFHVPRINISELLRSSREHVRIVGAIAALHVSAVKISEREQSKIIQNLTLMVVNSNKDPIVKMHAARTLWHLRFCTFRTTGHILMDRTTKDGFALQTWQKDVKNNRTCRNNMSRVPLRRRHHKCGKIRPSPLDMCDEENNPNPPPEIEKRESLGRQINGCRLHRHPMCFEKLRKKSS